VQSTEPRGDEVRIVPDVAVPVPGADGEASGVVEPWVEEGSLPVHLEIGDEGVPVRDRTPAGPGVQVHSGETEGRRDERGRGLSVRPEPFPVQEDLGVELARSPPEEHLAQRVLRHAEESRHRREIGRQVDDGPHVQVLVGPAVQAMTDAGGEGVIDGGMAHRALDADRPEPALSIRKSSDAEDGVAGEESHGHRGIVEVDRSGLQCADGRT
jgi:hypothetical protein